MNRLWDSEAKPGKEVTLAVLPLFHAYGLTVAMNNSLLLGGTLVLLPRFDLDLVFKAIDEWKPTLFPGVPPIYKALSDSPKAKSHDLKSIRLCVSGAMKLPVEIAEQFTRISGCHADRGLRPHRDLAVDARQPGQGRQARHHRPAAARDRLPDRRPGRPQQGDPDRQAGRARHRRAAGLLRLLGPRGRERLVHRGRLRPDRRRRGDGRGRLLLDRRSQEGAHHRRRLQHLPLRGGGGAVHPRRRRRTRSSSVSRTSTAARR